MFWIPKIALVYIIQSISIELGIQYDRSAKKFPKVSFNFDPGSSEPTSQICREEIFPIHFSSVPE